VPLPAVLLALRWQPVLAWQAIERLRPAGCVSLLEAPVLQRPSGSGPPVPEVLRPVACAAPSALLQPMALAWRRTERGPQTRRA
jgi:hypothetical protein